MNMLMFRFVPVGRAPCAVTEEANIFTSSWNDVFYRLVDNDINRRVLIVPNINS